MGDSRSGFALVTAVGSAKSLEFLSKFAEGESRRFAIGSDSCEGPCWRDHDIGEK